MGPKDPGRKERTYSWQKSIANSRQELAKTGCGRKTASRRMARVAHTCNDVYQVGKQSQVLHSRSSTMSQQHHLRCTGRRIDTELGKRDHVTGTPLEQVCDMVQKVLTRRLCQGVESKRKHRAPQGSSGATTGAARHRRCSRFSGSPVAVNRRDHRHHWSADSKGRGGFPAFSTQSRWSVTLLRVLKTAQMPLVQFTERSWSRSR